MNRLARIARRLGLSVTIAVLALALAAPVFAAEPAGGALTFTSDTQGKTNVPIDNVGIKLIFNGDVTASTVWESNKNAFTLTGKVADAEDPTKFTEVNIPVEAYPGQKEDEDNYILVLADPEPIKEGFPGQLLQKTQYVLTVSGNIASVDGKTLGSDGTVSFTTLDVAANSKLSVLVMVLMLVAAIALMVVTNWRKMKAEAEAAALMKANPYRIAKEKKITVDEAKELIEKAKEKNRKQLEKTGGRAPTAEEVNRSVPRIETKAQKKKKTYKVSGARSAFAAGSKYAAQQKAEAERKRKAALAKRASQNRQQGKNSGRSKNTKKKK